MTKKKTSIEKLETRNEKVTDLKSALVACLWKWREIRYEAVELWELITHTCGFCIYALQDRSQDHRSKCSVCPAEVKTFCGEMQEKTQAIMLDMDKQIGLTFEFLAGLKYDEDES